MRDKNNVRGLTIQINFRPTEFLGDDHEKVAKWFNGTATNKATREQRNFRRPEQLVAQIALWMGEKHNANLNRDKENILLQGKVLKAERMSSKRKTERGAKKEVEGR